MSETDNHFLEELINGSSTNAISWWEKVSSGEVVLPLDFNWYLLASKIVVNAYRYSKTDDEKSCLEWAELAIVIEAMLAKSPEEHITHSCEMSAMTLRAKMICKFGHISDHPVLDSNLIFKWFHDRLPFSLTEMIERERKWWSLSNEERVSSLKANPAEHFKTTYVKNRLTVIDVLKKCERVPISEEAMQWLKAIKDFYS